VNPPVHVLVVDDSVLYRRVLTKLVEGLGDTEVVGVAAHGQIALGKLERAEVDLVLLDVMMPVMDGLEALAAIRQRFIGVEVVMLSGDKSKDLARRALRAGALDFLAKPDDGQEASQAALREQLRRLVGVVRTRRHLRGGDPAPMPAPPLRAPSIAPPMLQRIDVVAIAVSTGGPDALLQLVPRLPADVGVPILIVQHMPPVFTQSLAEHLARKTSLAVREAEEGDRVVPGIFLAPGGRHMRVQRLGPLPSGIGVVLDDGPPEQSCRPSANVLFRSVATAYEGRVLAVVMTGMGADGCEGVRVIKQHGGYCLTQSEDTCVVYGMPMAVDEAGLSDERVPLDRLAYRIASLVARGQAQVAKPAWGKT
jgi:two-component system chemotaxis response regulator CheB